MRNALTVCSVARDGLAAGIEVMIQLSLRLMKSLLVVFCRLLVNSSPVLR